ncbi:metallophosphoesterase [Sediminibacillus albus]|uniref:Predicted phosphohydrolase, MPP superfamily n=1 Tax=Sediminibacillus albus TaxID=407036 RepID=A0A1G8VLZ6_9BACI|nr:metallophosphoesterase [Sediminibacillus albus]SDJ66954.1 Predicted phosphohydrolase, MPP superfamily [Sediminibacillus albus]
MGPYIFGFIVLALLFIVFMVYKAHQDHLRYNKISISKHTMDNEQINLFFISDIHKRIIKEHTLAQIQQPLDLVIIGGDLTESKVPWSKVSTNLARLHRMQAPIFFIWGNNDYEVDRYKLLQLLVDQHVHILTNETVNITLKNNRAVSLIGVDDPDNSSPIMDLLVREAAGEVVILLSHRPSVFEEMEDVFTSAIDVVLSGHTHGGQIRIFGFGPYTRGGVKQMNSKPILISEGYGYTSLPFRLGTTAECHVVTIL